MRYLFVDVVEEKRMVRDKTLIFSTAAGVSEILRSLKIQEF